MYSRQEQIASYLRDQIVAGRLANGSRLPSTRGLARDLGVSRQTISLAYERLLIEGLLRSAKGKGTFVTLEPGLIQARSSRPKKQSCAQSTVAKRGLRLLDIPITPMPKMDQGLLTPGVPALDLFPWGTWNQAGYRVAWQRAPNRLDRVSPCGSPQLRKAISNYIALSRGVVCEPEQVIVTAGSQNAIDLVSRVTFDPGETVWVEDPCYVAGRGTLLVNGANVQPVRVDAEGLVVSQGRRLAPAARAAIVTPSYQYPLGITMSLRRRHSLLEWAVQQRAWIVENDYDSDFRYDGRSPPTLHAMSAAYGDVVIYLGTFSNSLAPGLRLGFLVAPSRLVEPITRARIFSDRQPPEPLQTQLAAFIETGHLAAHLHKMRDVYRQRRDAVFGVLKENSAGQLDPGEKPPASGLHITASLPNGEDKHLSEKAKANGIRVPPLSQFYLDRRNTRQGLIIGFAGTPAEAAKRAAQTLCRLA